MWKAFLCRSTRVVLPEPDGIWLGDRTYAVRFPVSGEGIMPGRLAAHTGRAVVDGVKALPGGRLLLVLDEGAASISASVIPDPEAEALIGPLEGERIGVADPGILGRAAKLAIAASDVRSAAVRIERGPRGSLLAVPVAGERELEPLRLRGELPVGLVLPARTLRLAYWSGLRDGLVSIARADDGRFLVLAMDGAGRRYRIV